MRLSLEIYLEGKLKSSSLEKYLQLLSPYSHISLSEKVKKRSKNVIHLIMYKFIYLQQSIDIALKHVILIIPRNMARCENCLPCEIYHLIHWVKNHGA